MPRCLLLSALLLCFLLSNCGSQRPAASGSDFAASSGALLGGGGLRTFVFTALAPGSTAVRLAYRRPWEPKASAGEAFEVRIQVQTKAPS